MSLYEATQYSLVIISLILIALFIIVMMKIQKIIGQNMGIPPGLKLPDIKGIFEGKVISVNTYINKSKETMMICIVDPNCKYCREIAPKLLQQYQEKEFNLLFLISKIDLSENIGVEEIAPNIIVSPVDIIKKYKVSSFPYCFIVSPKEEVIKRGLIEDNNMNLFIDYLNER